MDNEQFPTHTIDAAYHASERNRPRQRGVCMGRGDPGQSIPNLARVAVYCHGLGCRAAFSGALRPAETPRCDARRIGLDAEW